MAKVILNTPIKRGDQEITEVEFREPDTGALRGLKVVDVLNMDVAQHSLLIPRISNITRPEFEGLKLKDSLAVMQEVNGFFV